MSGELTKTVANGTLWTAVSQFVSQGMRFLGMIVLAWLLVPEEIGIAAMAAVVTTVVLRIVDVGFNEAIIQRKSVTPSHLSTAFWIILAFSTTVYVVVAAASPLVGRFFGNDLVAPVLAVSALSFIIMPLGSIHGALLRRDLRFVRLSLANIIEAVVYLGVALPMAFSGLGVWSLVGGNLAGIAAQVIARWLLCRWLPSFHFSLDSLRDLRSFGLNVTGSRLASVLVERLDYLIAGRFLGAATLGLYSMALRIARFPSENLWYIVTKVALPAFSLLQDEDERLRRGFLKSTAFIATTAMPVFVGIAVVAPELVRVALDSEWLPIIVPLQILCVSGAVNALRTSIPSLFLSKGRPDILLRLNLVQTAVLVPALIAGAQFGIRGIAAGVVATEFASWLLLFLFAARLIDLRIGEYLRAVWAAALACSAMAAGVLGLRYAMHEVFGLHDVAVLAVSVLFGAGLYVVVLKLIRSETLNEIIDLSREMAGPFGAAVVARLPLARK
jgi:PST family polysaccharide transporter